MQKESSKACVWIPSKLILGDWGLPGVSRAMQQNCLALYTTYLATTFFGNELDDINIDAIGNIFGVSGRTTRRYNEILENKGLIQVKKNRHSMAISLPPIPKRGKITCVPVSYVLDPNLDLDQRAVLIDLAWYEDRARWKGQVCPKGDVGIALLSFRDLTNLTGFGRHKVREILKSLHSFNYIHIPVFSNDSKFRVEIIPHKHGDYILQYTSQAMQNYLTEYLTNDTSFVRTGPENEIKSGQNHTPSPDKTVIPVRTKPTPKTALNYLPGQVFANLLELILRYLELNIKKDRKNTTYFSAAAQTQASPGSVLKIAAEFFNGFKIDLENLPLVEDLNNSARVQVFDILKTFEVFMDSEGNGFDFMSNYARENKIDSLNEEEKEIEEEVKKGKAYSWDMSHFLRFFNNCYTEKYNQPYAGLTEGKSRKLMGCLVAKRDGESDKEYKTRKEALRDKIKFLHDHWGKIRKKLSLKEPETPTIQILHVRANDLSGLMADGFGVVDSDRDYDLRNNLTKNQGEASIEPKTRRDSIQEYLDS